MQTGHLIANRFIIHDPVRMLLGHGGMGDVYQAEDLETSQPVAVKILKPDLGRDVVARFRREGEVLERLNHPHIVQMIASVVENGRYYLIMEYVSGGSLRERLNATGAWPVARVLEWGRALTDALVYAHQHHIIHRDLKPDNVLLAADDTPRLTDFGIAYVADRTQLTASDALIGTFGYHSPEAFKGDKLDERADIWSLGVIFYEMLVGERPFVGSNLAATFSAILTQPVPHKLQQKKIPNSLISLIHYMLLKDHQQRIRSMKLVKAELEAIFNGKQEPIYHIVPTADSLPFAQYALPTSEMLFHDMVHTLLRQYRNGDWLELASSILAYSPLVEDCFLSGEIVSIATRAHAMQSILCWAIDRLKPSGKQNWLSPTWRFYNILYHFYLQGMRVAEMAEHMAIAEQTLYQWRQTAVAALSRLLRAEMDIPQAREERRHYVLASRFSQQSPTAQEILQQLAVYRSPISSQWLAQLATISDLTLPLQALIHAQLVQTRPGNRVVKIHPEMASYVLTLLPAKTRQAQHHQAGKYYRDRYEYLEAAYHFRAAGAWETAVHLLINHYRDIIDSEQGEAYADLLSQFQPYELSPGLWPQLKIIAGQVAEILEDIDSALNEYQQALSAEDIHTKALAYYRRAKAWQHKNIQEALAHYAYCIRLVQENDLPDFPLAEVLVDRAWIYFQELRDFVSAEADLQWAEALVSDRNRRTWSDLHNAWGELYYHQHDLEQAISHLMQGWLAANEIQDAERMMKTSHNLGQVYAEAGKHKPALSYLQRSQQLAAAVGHRKMEGMTYKSIGACYFWLQQFSQAIHHYQKAYEIFVEIGNDLGRAYTCYDLAEGYTHLGNDQQAHYFWQEGMTLAQYTGNTGLIKGLQALLATMPPQLPDAADLNAREQHVLAYVQTNGRITNQEYRALTTVSQKQAVRDLNKLVEDGHLIRLGQGRGTHYEIP